MPTPRGFTRKAFQCGLYEAQDVLAGIDDVDLMFLEPHPGFAWKTRWQRRLLYRDVTRRLVFANPGLKPLRVERDYDVFIAVCQSHHDLLYLSAIEGWKKRCRVSVCWIDELWASFIPEYKYWLHALQQFDHVFLGASGSVEGVAKAIGRECHWMPGAVDTLRFSPFPDSPPRVIDIYSIGRRAPAIHDALRRRAVERQIFYLHDTFVGSEAETFDHRQHRDMFAGIAKRSRYFVVAPGKVDVPGERVGQIEVGYRYFEGAAAGAVMIGQPATSVAFSEMFGWPDAVIPIKQDGSDVMEVLDALECQSSRLHEIALRNATGALRRHDWVHRWNRLFTIAGLPLPRGSEARVQQLNSLAATATAGMGPG